MATTERREPVWNMTRPAEQGEDASKKAYAEALKKTDLQASVRQILERQRGDITLS